MTAAMPDPQSKACSRHRFRQLPQAAFALTWLELGLPKGLCCCREVASYQQAFAKLEREVETQSLVLVEPSKNAVWPAGGFRAHPMHPLRGLVLLQQILSDDCLNSRNSCARPALTFLPLSAILNYWIRTSRHVEQHLPLRPQLVRRGSLSALHPTHFGKVALCRHQQSMPPEGPLWVSFHCQATHATAHPHLRFALRKRRYSGPTPLARLPPPKLGGSPETLSCVHHCVSSLPHTHPRRAAHWRCLSVLKLQRESAGRFGVAAPVRRSRLHPQSEAHWLEHCELKPVHEEQRCSVLMTESRPPVPWAMYALAVPQGEVRLWLHWALWQPVAHLYTA